MTQTPTNKLPPEAWWRRMVRRLLAAACVLLITAFPASAITLEQFGGGVSVADNSVAFNAALASLPPEGGVIELGCGTYRTKANLVLASSVSIDGCGRSSVIDCTAVTVAGPCLKVGPYNNTVRDLRIVGANGPGIEVSDAAYIEISNVSIIDTRSVDVTPWNDSCLLVKNTWMSSFRDLRLTNCRTFGMQVAGFSTSLVIERVYAENPVKSGFYLNDLTYSTLTSTGADKSGDYGYMLRNLRGVTFISPGGEANAKGMFLALASDSIANGATVPDILGVVIIGAFALGNGTAAAYYSNFLEASSSDGRTIDITLIGPVEHTIQNGVAMILTGRGVRVRRIGGALLGTVSASGGAVYSV